LANIFLIVKYYVFIYKVQDYVLKVYIDKKLSCRMKPRDAPNRWKFCCHSSSLIRSYVVE